LQLRGYASSSFRGPNVYQSFPGNVVVPTLFTVPGNPLPIFVPVLNSGNPKLGPEYAVTVSGGFAWTPVDELTLLAEFWSYDYRHRILPENAVQIGNQYLVDMAAGRNPSDPRIIADNNGNLQSVNVQSKNTPGSIVTNGVDFAAFVSLTGATFGGGKDDFGTISFGGQGTYTLTYDMPYAEMLTDAVKDGIKCDGTSPTSACHVVGYRNATNAIIPPVPRWRVNFPVNWSIKGHSATVIAHYTSSVIDDQFAANNAGRVVALPIMKGLATLDLQYGYTLKDFIGKELTMRLGVYNLFDTPPPAALGGGLSIAGYDPDLYDPRGRMIYAKLVSQF
jgi:outer membrane receptor protein involved in Fe transport